MLKQIMAIGLLLSSSQGFAQSNPSSLESPVNGSSESGIGIIRGWICEATTVLIQIDNFPPLEAAYGTDRNDTLTVCGDTKNSFGLTFNWSLLSVGQHTVRAIADGVEFGSASFNVTNLGVKFLSGASGSFTLEGFPEAADTTQVGWSQANQNFVIGTANNSTTSAGNARQQLESPQTGSGESGISLIRGWACEATGISIKIDNFDPLPAAYGTARADTATVCGDIDNGFGLIFNWNLLGDGQHTVKALADGVEFASVTFNVTTLGTNFLSGASGDFLFTDFPETGRNTVVRWSQAHQNFIVVGYSGNNDPALLGAWSLQTIDGEPLPFPFKFVTATFGEDSIAVTTNVPCKVDVAYVTVGDEIKGTVTNTEGLFCPAGFGSQGTGHYTIEGTTLTVSGTDEQGASAVSVFTRLQ